MTRARDLSKFANSQAFSVDNDFQVGINSTVPAATLDVRGDSVITGVLTATSFSGTVDATGLTGTPDITVNNIVGAAATFSGVVTYEDVTNVDSVGVITARSGVRILVGESLLLQNAAGSAEGSIECDGAGTNTDIRIRTNSTERLRVTHAGLVGIGTDSPGDELDIQNNGASFINIKNNTDGGRLVLGSNTSANQIKSADSGNGARALQIFTGTTTTNGINIDTSGRVLVGNTQDSSPFSWGIGLQVAGTSTNAGLSIRRDQNSSGGALLMFVKSRGSLNGNTVVQDGDQIGGMYFNAADGTDVNSYAAQIAAEIDGTPGSNDVPGRLKFSTTSDGAAAPTEAFRVDSSQRLLVGTTSSTGDALLQIQGDATSSLHGSQLFMRRGEAPTSISAGELLGQIVFTDNAGGNFGVIKCEADASAGTNDFPGRLTFFTTADGASSPTERMRIDDQGRVAINDTTPDARLDIGGDDADIRLGGSQYFRFKALSTGELTFNDNDTNERLRIDSSGNHILGHNSAIGNMKFGGSGDFGSHSYVVGSNRGFANGLAILNYDATATVPALLKLATSRSDTIGTNTIVGNNNDNVGGIQFMGNDGTRFIDVARIDAVTDNVVGSNDMPGRLSFFTTANGASVVTERMRIASNGLHRMISSDQPTLEIRNTSSSASNTLMQCAGGVTDMTSGGSVVMKVLCDGDLENTNNSYGAISDSKLKENIVDCGSEWNDVKALQVRKYNFKEETGYSTHTQIGVVAQEVELVSPGLVSESPDKDAEGNDLGTTTKSVNYSVLYMKAVKALQEAMTRIETLETKVAALEAE